MISKKAMWLILGLCALGLVCVATMSFGSEYLDADFIDGIAIIASFALLLVAIIVFFSTNDEKLEYGFYGLMKRKVGIDDVALQAHEKIGELLKNAVEKKDTSLVALLLGRYLYDDESLLDAWEISIKNSSWGIMESLISKSPTLIDSQVFDNGMTALILAATADCDNDDELINWLLKHGADKTKQDCLGRTFDDYLSRAEKEDLGLLPKLSPPLEVASTPEKSPPQS